MAFKRFLASDLVSVAGLCFLLLLVASTASAATLNVVSGILLGASGVIVDGRSYDVEFLDGTCVELYNGCDSGSDFAFETVAAAHLASRALLDQVLVDGPLGLFDTDPELTFGCPDGEDACQVRTPGALLFAGAAYADAATAVNHQLGAGTEDYAYELLFSVVHDTSPPNNSEVIAVWTPVSAPVPGPRILVAPALLAMGVRILRKV